MKFHDIAIGTRFEFEGVEYTKTSPMLATSQSGKQRLIRRSAHLKPVGTDGPQKESPVTLDQHQVLQAFDTFYQTCIQLSGTNPELESARQKFLDTLK